MSRFSQQYFDVLDTVRDGIAGVSAKIVEHPAFDCFHPGALLGYLGLLEGYPPQPEHVEELIRRSGAPAHAWSTYRLHGELDPWHREELEAMLDQVPERDGPSVRPSSTESGAARPTAKRMPITG